MTVCGQIRSMNRSCPMFCAKAVLTVLLAALSVPSAAAELTALNLSESGTYSRAEFALSGPAEYKVFTLSNPDRLVVDLQDSRQIGRASCRERVCQYGEIWVVGGALQKKTT